MLKLSSSFITILSAVIILLSAIRVSSQTTSSPQVGAFLSASAGSFNISFPKNVPSGQAIGENICFDDIYGSESGLSYGVEGGLGFTKSGIYGVLKYRIWNKQGQPWTFGGISFSGDTEWKQNFVAIGLRYFMVEPSRQMENILPYLGAGLIRSSATESMKGQITFEGQSAYVDLSEDVDGTGFYVEGGLDFYVAPNFSIRVQIEY
jgi:opacity protein-like surface antigen